MTTKLRELLIEYNNLGNPDGSALFCQGNTVVQSYVYGPVDVSSSKEKSDKASLFVIYKPKNSCNKHDLRIELYEDYITKILESVIYLEMHPRTSITVIIQEIQDDGCLLSSAVNGACCALLDAGVPMKSMIASVTAYLNPDSRIVLDVNKEDAEDMKSSLVLTYESIGNKVVSITNDGSFTIDHLKEAIKLGSLASKEIYDFYHKSMRKRFLLT